MSNINYSDVIVIGGGIFGCLIAIELSRKGLKVQIHEKNNQIMLGASLNNQNRLHLGYHYPRDLETVAQCKKGFKSFKNRFAECILENFDNTYFISSVESNLNFQQYKKFCETSNLPIREVKLNNFFPMMENIEGGLFTDEVVYDSTILQKLVADELKNASVRVLTNSNVQELSEIENGFAITDQSTNFHASAVINCTYANFNDFNHGLGLVSQKLKYELTIVPIVKWREGLNPIGITVMDGRFFTVLPHGRTGNYLLYHVDHTVHDTREGYSYPIEWRNARNFVGTDNALKAFSKIKASSAKWLPDIANAEFVDYLTTVRVVLADVETSDKRPSLINRSEAKHPYFTVFSGKIDHSIWVAKEITHTLYSQLVAI